MEIVLNFNSLTYFLFLPATLLFYFLLPKRWKNPVLLVASYIFYMGWGPPYALLLLFSTLTTWIGGLLIAGTPQRNRLWLVMTILVNFAILFIFKYFNFFTELLSAIGIVAGGVHLNLMLPVGISFFTFQSVGYSIDVYRGTIPAERSFVDYALFVSFFPQLVAGPIDRASNLLPQIKTIRRFSDENLKAGALRFFWGLMKKMVLADQLAVVVDTAFADIAGFNGGQLLVAVICFSFQIYCDFSAYSDIAIGSAQMLGLRLMENFRFPYGAHSIKEFWRRWHISLSSWFQDYLYFPMGGSRVPKWRHCFNLVFVFAVSGLWHGAALTFVLWGLIYGLVQAGGVLLEPLRKWFYRRVLPREHVLVRIATLCFTFAFVSGAWIFFRAQTVPDALNILCSIGLFFAHPYIPAITELGQSRQMLFVMAVFLGILTMTDALREKYDLSDWLCRRDVLRYAVYFLLIASILVFGYYGNAYDAQEFVYFRF